MENNETNLVLQATHIATISEYGLSGDERLISIVENFSFDDVFDGLTVEDVPYGYLVLSEPLLLCGASIIYGKEMNEYTVVVMVDIEYFLASFELFLNRQADLNEQN